MEEQQLQYEHNYIAKNNKKRESNKTFRSNASKVTTLLAINIPPLHTHSFSQRIVYRKLDLANQ